MTTEYAPTNQPTSSAMGRRWLRALNQSSAEKNSKLAGHQEVVVVSIPDLRPETTSPSRETSHRNEEARFDAIHKRHSAQAQESGIKSEVVADASFGEMDFASITAPDKPELSVEKAKVVDSSQNDWHADRRETDPSATSSESSGYVESLDQSGAELAPLLAQIKEKFPGDAPRILLFTGSESNPHTFYTCSTIAISLANQGTGRVLIVDSDFANATLSKKQNLSNKAGLSNSLVQNIDWKTTVFKTGVSRVDFLAAGNQRVRRLQTADDLLTEISSGLRAEYQYVCVNVGDAHEEGACLWSDHCDGTYLIVSMNGSSQTIAKSAVSQLQNYGARLVGCVVSEPNHD